MIPRRNTFFEQNWIPGTRSPAGDYVASWHKAYRGIIPIIIRTERDVLQELRLADIKGSTREQCYQQDTMKHADAGFCNFGHFLIFVKIYSLERLKTHSCRFHSIVS